MQSMIFENGKIAKSELICVENTPMILITFRDGSSTTIYPKSNDLEFFGLTSEYEEMLAWIAKENEISAFEKIERLLATPQNSNVINSDELPLVFSKRRRKSM